MALCEKFNCKRRSFCRASTGCESSCLVALDIYKCNACLNKEACKNTALYKQRQAEKEHWLKKTERSKKHGCTND